MSKGRAGNMLGVGGTRSHLSRKQLRGFKGGGAPGANTDPQAQKRELLKKLRDTR